MIRSKKETCNGPEVSYNVSGNRRQLVTYQNDPATGQHCYYACSKKPIEEWNNLKSGVIQNESVNEWKERGELEELNGKESQNSSIDIPRCVMQSTNPQVDFHIYEERHSGRDQIQSQRLPNLSNNSHFVTPGLQRRTNYNKTYSERPETPQVFGGTGRQARPFEAEQFGLSKNEQFRSPRGVFQNLNYDRFQSPMQPRLTDEVITSFDNARIRRDQTLGSTKDNDARQKLCARLQKVRNEMHKKPQIEIQEQIEVEPENYHYEPITLREPCAYTSCHQETDQDLGILSAEEMDDEDLFNDQETIDPKTIFKTRDENLVSRNVVKIETNTTINGSKREVVEEFLEQEDVNVEERPEDNENLVNVSEPTFESVPGYSPLQLSDQIQKKLQNQKHKTRRILEDYSDWPNEDLEDISQPCFQQRSFCPEEDRGARQGHSQSQASSRRLPTERLDEISQPEFVSSIEDPTTFRLGNKPFINALDRLEKTIQEVSRRRALFGGVNNSDRLENISQPIFESSYENSSHRPFNQFEESERLESIEQPYYQSFEESTSRINQSRARERPFPQIYTKERLDQVSQPSFGSSLKDATVKSRLSRGNAPQRRFPQVETSERLDDVSQPHLFHSTGLSYQDSRSRRCPCSKRPIPQFDTSEQLDDISRPCFEQSLKDSTVTSSQRERMTSERLDEVSQPDLLDSTGVSYQDSRGRRCPPSRRPIPQVDTSERVKESFEPSLRDSTVTSRRRGQRCQPEVETSERLDEVSEPRFLHSTGVSYQDSTSRRCPLRQRPVAQVDTSERLEEISQPSFDSSLRDSTVPSRQRDQRRLPEVETSERLDEVSQPRFLHSTGVSYQDSTGRRYPLSQRPTPQVDTSERLDDISRPSFEPSLRNSTVPSRQGQQRRLPEVETSERLYEVRQPRFLHSTGVSYQDSTSRRCPLSQRPIPQVDTSERLEEISQPNFESSLMDSREASRQRERRRLPEVETSERLDEVSQPTFLHSTGVSYQDSTSRRPCQRPIYQFDTSERLDDISRPNFECSSRDSTVPSRQRERRRLPEVETFERLNEISQPEFLHSTEMSYQDSNSRRCPPSQKPMPYDEMSERLEEISCPQFLSSTEDSRQGSRRPQFQLRESQRLDEVTQPSAMKSLRDSTMKSRGRKDPPQVDKCEQLIFNSQAEILDDVSQPVFQSSFEESKSKSRGNREKLWPRKQLQIDESECLEDICQPEFASSVQTSSLQDTKDGRRTSNRKNLLSVDVSERLENICEPEFPSSFEDATDTQRTGKQNVSERLDYISQPSFPLSVEESCRRLRDSKKGVPEARPLPQFDESEILNQVTQPDLTSFEEDTGYRSKDSGQAKSIFCKSEESERLDDISQPHFESSYRDSMIKSKDNVCQPEFPPSFEVSGRSAQRRQSHFVESERLEDVTQPSMQTSFPEESSKALRKSLDDRRKKLLSRVNISEVLDDVSQPFYHTTLEDSMFDRRDRQVSTQRAFPPESELEKSEKLERVSQPVFPSSFEDTGHTSRETEEIQRRPRKKTETSERLIDVSHQFLPSSFEDSKKSSGRYIETPKRRLLPHIDASENLDDISHPLFISMYEEMSNRQRRSENIQKRRPSPQADESERLEDVSQPEFPSSFKHSMALSKDTRQYQSHAGATKIDGRPFQQINVSERLNEISQPDFETSLEDTIPSASERRPLNQTDFSQRHRKTQQQRYLPEVDVSERLSSVCQPEFPSSFEDSRQCSVRNKSNRKTIPKHHVEKPQFDTSEMLEDVAEPKFPSSIQGSMNISRERRRRPMPQIDLSENIESICQPEFPQSFEDSTRNDALTYRRDKFPKETMDENLEDISCPSFQETPILRRRQNEDHRSRGPQRQLFPKEVSRTERSERPGDFRQVFETMPNYAPFEQQVAARKKNLNSRLKMPVTFDQPLGVLGKNKPEVCPRLQQQPSQRYEPTREDFCVNRIKPSQVNPCTIQVPSQGIQMERRQPSVTRIPLPPSARSQTNIRRQQQQSKLEKPQDEERLVKKSSVKFHKTKSTYFKNQQNKSNRNEGRKR
ncbi:uncharacterized protein LOC129916061 isoform X2 [Episyrphus balteatus]|nr:uncharacterized protein LOC129916061 isoform X2 [Episyrphus balteatus]